MFLIEEREIGSVPLLHITSNDGPAKKPALLFYHGITSAKEHNLHIAYTFAKKGFRVLLPDALHHGEREKSIVGEKRYLSFWDIVLQSIHEVPTIAEPFLQEGLIDENRIAIGGTSMGAITAYGALAAYPWLCSGCCFMGAPQYMEFSKAMFEKLEQHGVEVKEAQKEAVLAKISPFDLTADIERLNGRPLFIWHGKQDDTVPFMYAEQFANRLFNAYQGKTDRFQFIAEEGAGHKISRKAMLAAAEFLPQAMGSSHVSRTT